MKILSDDWSVDIIQVFLCAHVIAEKSVGTDVCLAVRKLHLSDDWSADITQVFSCARVVAGKNAEMDSKMALASFS